MHDGNIIEVTPTNEQPVTIADEILPIPIDLT